MPAPKWNRPLPLRPVISVPGFEDKVKGLMETGISNPGTTGPMYDDVSKPAVQPNPKVGPRPTVGFGGGPTFLSIGGIGAGFDLIYGASLKDKGGSGGSGSGRMGGKKLKI